MQRVRGLLFGVGISIAGEKVSKSKVLRGGKRWSEVGFEWGLLATDSECFHNQYLTYILDTSGLLFLAYTSWPAQERIEAESLSISLGDRPIQSLRDADCVEVGDVGCEMEARCVVREKLCCCFSLTTQPWDQAVNCFEE